MSHNEEVRNERELGMDAEILAIAYAKCQGFLKFAEEVRKCGISSEKARKCLEMLEDGFSTLMHDTSIAYLKDLASESAWSIPVRLVPKVANDGMDKRLDALTLKVGSAAE